MKMDFVSDLNKILINISDSPNTELKGIIDDYKNYFNHSKNEFEIETLVLDDCFYRDYSRNDLNRILDSNKIKNPFSLSKYSIDSTKKIWYTKLNNNLEGPFDTLFMDELFDLGRLKNYDLIGINKIDFFTVLQFISIIYTIPKNKKMTEIKPKSIKFKSKAESKTNSSIFNDDDSSSSLSNKNFKNSNQNKKFITPKLSKNQKNYFDNKSNNTNEFYKKTFSATQMKSLTHKKNFSKNKVTEVKLNKINEEFIIVKKFELKKRDYNDKAKFELNKVKNYKTIKYDDSDKYQNFKGNINEEENSDISFEIN